MGNIRHLFQENMGKIKYLFQRNMGNTRHLFQRNIGNIRHLFQRNIGNIRHLFQGNMGNIRHLFQGNMGKIRHLVQRNIGINAFISWVYTNIDEWNNNGFSFRRQHAIKSAFTSEDQGNKCIYFEGTEQQKYLLYGN